MNRVEFEEAIKYLHKNQHKRTGNLDPVLYDKYYNVNVYLHSSYFDNTYAILYGIVKTYFGNRSYHYELGTLEAYFKTLLYIFRP